MTPVAPATKTRIGREPSERDLSDVTRAALWHPARGGRRCVLKFHQETLSWAESAVAASPGVRRTNPFRVLVAEVMLQRSRGVTVEKVYRESVPTLA